MLLDGEALYTVNGTQMIAQKGDIILINIGDFHSCQIDHKAQTCEAINIIFPEEFLRYFSKSDRLFFEIRKEGNQYRQLKQQLLDLYQLFINRFEDPFSQLLINSAVCTITHTLYTGFQQADFQSLEILSEKYKKRCKNVMDYIDQNYREDLTLEVLSEEFGLSKDHISRIFRSCMGVTFKQHLTRVRMYHAYKLLIHTDLTLLEISMESGFSDSRAFISSFKQVYNTTPSQYRSSLERISDIQARAENRKAEFFKET